MKSTWKALIASALFLAPAASYATKVPIPIEGATLNVSVQIQTEALFTENGNPAGDGWATDLFVRRTRLLVNGDISQNFSYLMQLDNPNFGKFGNFTGRAIIQDAWIGWAPTGITGGTVVYLDAGLLLIPISHHLLTSTTNFVTADVHGDEFRFPGNAFPAFRETGVQLRGWALDKKIGFRGGVYEGYAPLQTAGASTTTPCAPATSPGTSPVCVTPDRSPQLAGFVNFDVIGSEEGGWLYGAYKWGKDPVVSVGASTVYQSRALKNLAGSLTDQRLHSADLYINLPMTEAAELVVEGTVYLNRNGNNSANTGLGAFVDVGYRFGPIAPYASYSYFQADDCDATAACATAATGPHSADSRNFKAGLNFFFNKNLNHLNLEFQANHGQSAFGAQSITTATAGYVPVGASTSLAASTTHSLLAHWNVLF